MQTVEAMEKRRRIIVTAAQRLIAEQEESAFTIRKLARAADVSVATIYNLIGDRNEVLLAVCKELTNQIRQDITDPDTDDVILIIETRLEQLINLTKIREKVFRSSYTAFDLLSQQKAFQSETNEMQKASEEDWTELIRIAQNAGSLKSQLPAELIGKQIYRVYLSATKDWAYRRMSFKDYRTTARLGVYVALLADANRAVRTRMVERINQIGVTSFSK